MQYCGFCLYKPPSFCSQAEHNSSVSWICVSKATVLSLTWIKLFFSYYRLFTDYLHQQWRCPRPMSPVKSSSCLATLGKVLLETHNAQDALVVRNNDTEVVHLQLLVALYLKVNGNIDLNIYTWRPGWTTWRYSHSLLPDHVDLAGRQVSIATVMIMKQSRQYKGDPGLELGPCSSAAQAATAAAACSQPQQELQGQGGTGTTHVCWCPWSLDDTGLRLPPWALAGKALLGYSPSGIWPHQCRRDTKSNESMKGKLLLRVKWIWSKCFSVSTGYHGDPCYSAQTTWPLASTCLSGTSI